MTTRSADASPYPRLLIDVGAIRRNYARIQSLTGTADVAAVVKADAYGLGAATIAPALADAGAQHFFVANGREGASLRAALGPDPSIFVLHGYWTEDAPLIEASGLIPVINTPGQLQDWLNGSGGDFALHFDTGINRLGIPMSQLAAVQERCAERKPCLVMSHFACADEPGHRLNRDQIDRFAGIRAAFPGVRTSLANSAGCLLGGDALGDLVRPGIALYGGAPGSGKHPFESAVQIEAPILQVRRATRPETAGYGATWCAEGDCMLATVALGYADGIHRAAQNGGYGRLDGIKVPIAGRVSMDLITLDVTSAGDAAHPGAMVSFLGEDLDAFANASGTLAYEVLTRLGARFERVYR